MSGQKEFFSADSFAWVLEKQVYSVSKDKIVPLGLSPLDSLFLKLSWAMPDRAKYGLIVN